MSTSYQLILPFLFPRLIRDASLSKNDSEIRKVIDLLEQYSLALNPHVKKGGLIGLAAAAAGLGTQVLLVCVEYCLWVA